MHALQRESVHMEYARGNTQDEKRELEDTEQRANRALKRDCMECAESVHGECKKMCIEHADSVHGVCRRAHGESLHTAGREHAQAERAITECLEGHMWSVQRKHTQSMQKDMCEVCRMQAEVNQSMQEQV